MTFFIYFLASFETNKILLLFQAVSFKKTSRGLARSLWWKNIKLTVIIAVVILVSILNCRHRDKVLM